MITKLSPEGEARRACNQVDAKSTDCACEKLKLLENSFPPDKNLFRQKFFAENFLWKCFESRKQAFAFCCSRQFHYINDSQKDSKTLYSPRPDDFLWFRRQQKINHIPLILQFNRPSRSMNHADSFLSESSASRWQVRCRSVDTKSSRRRKFFAAKSFPIGINEALIDHKQFT